ncbi:ABC transporter substrate-binding protein [Roseateles toxinivorans]|uniref:NitT/TauT family transport system substrate-binding protein n=1 Tax=Roseateles toxinivorans TaxID=270368 RepID=A0A4V3CSV9_9BURK|nr:ABC transporter substrate-binding protein [Roseateles toxinivorans]TDP62054.1 NitT/TauT family transport system substrate-binding protein [Roseateles toxinivorans]
MRFPTPLRKLFVLLALVAASVSTAQAKDKVTFAITTYGWSYVPVLTAAQLGFYEQEGLDVEIINTGGGAKAQAALAGGSVDLYGSDAGFAIKARSKGSEVTLVGASMTEYATNIVVSGAWAKKNGITTASSYQDKLRAMKGITIGVLSRGSGHEQLVRFLAKEAKLDADRDLTITAMGTAAATIAAFEQGRITAFVHSAPIGERAVKDFGGVMMFNMSKGDVVPLQGFLYTAYVARESWIKSHEDVLVRFLRSQQRALNALHDPVQTKKARDALHAAYFSTLEPAFWNFVWDSNISAFPKTVEVTAKQMKQAVALIEEFQTERIPASAVDASWTNTYAQRAAQQLAAPGGK